MQSAVTASRRFDHLIEFSGRGALRYEVVRNEIFWIRSIHLFVPHTQLNCFYPPISPDALCLRMVSKIIQACFLPHGDVCMISVMTIDGGFLIRTLK